MLFARLVIPPEARKTQPLWYSSVSAGHVLRANDSIYEKKAVLNVSFDSSFIAYIRNS
ncbi:hypothetical protein PN4B1_01950 [Paenibacillus naphthalenovorans]|nr:hypothetical protein PN4B1_01950 [Paenibacillus naphthalenovorans]